ELQREPHARALAGVVMEMRHQHRPGVELHGADPPRQVLTKIGIGGDPHRGFRDEGSGVVDVPEGQPGGQADRAGIARWVADRAAIGAELQGEAALRGGGGQAMGGPAANALRTQWRRRFSERIFALWRRQRLAHAALAKAAAPDARPRSKLIMPKPDTTAR